MGYYLMAAMVEERINNPGTPTTVISDLMDSTKTLLARKGCCCTTTASL